MLLRAFRYDTTDAIASDSALRALFTSGSHPSRSPDENLADVHAQIAANQTGVLLLQLLIAQQGLSAVAAYTGHLQRTAENRMRAALRRFVSDHAKIPTNRSASASDPLPNATAGAASILQPEDTVLPSSPTAPAPDFTSSFRDTLDDGTPLVLTLTVRAEGAARFGNALFVPALLAQVRG